MDANVAAFALGLVVFALGHAAFRFTLWALIAGIGGWLIAAPWLTPSLLSLAGEDLPASWVAREKIWRLVCGRIPAQPLLGYGLDASRHYHPANQAGIPLHPHSGSLQIWYETGAVGAGLAALALAAGGVAAQRAFRDQPAAGGALCATIASAGLIGNVSFGVWQEWWIATIFAAIALSVAARRLYPPESLDSSRSNSLNARNT